MDSVKTLCHTMWECKYHVVWIPKYRRKVLYGQLRRHFGDLLHGLVRQKESQILEGHLCMDHIHNVDIGAAEVFRVTGCRLPQGKERHSHCPDVSWVTAQLQRDALLGARVLRVNRRRR